MKAIIPAPPKITELSCWDKESGLPKFLLGRYTGMEDDIAKFFQSLFHHSMPSTGKSVSSTVSASAKARLESLIQTGALASAFEDATLLQLHQAQQEGWHTQLGAEYDISTVRDLVELSLQKTIEKDPTGGMRYEYQKLLDVLKVIEGMAVKSATDNGDTTTETRKKISAAVNSMIANPNSRSKMRESGRAVEVILQSKESEAAKLEMAAQVFLDVSRQDVSVQEFRRRNRERIRTVGHFVPEPLHASIMLLAGRDYIVIESPNEMSTQSVQSALRGIATEFSISDPAIFLKKLTDELYTKNKYEYMGIRDKELIPVGHERLEYTITLPKQHTFQELVTNAVAVIAAYLHKLTEHDDTSVLVYEIKEGKTEKEILQILNVDDEEEGGAMYVALNRFYIIPPFVKTLLDGYDYDLALIANQIHLRIRRYL